MLQFINVNFTKPVIIEKHDVEFINCIFSVEGKNIKDNAGTALTINGTANAKISNCVFKNVGYNSINIRTTGMVAIERNTFISTNVYNPIECSGQNINNICIEKNIFNSVKDINLSTVIGYHKGGESYNFMDDYDERGKNGK